MHFFNRQEAGAELAYRLRRLGDAHPLVLGLSRGGMPVAAEVALSLRGELDAWAVENVPAPGSPQVTIGAVAEELGIYLDPHVIRSLGISDTEAMLAASRQAAEVDRRVWQYRHGRPEPVLQGRLVVMVDDASVSGATFLAALQAIARHAPARWIAAIPAATAQAAARIRGAGGDLVCLATVDAAWPLNRIYRDLSPVSDEEVMTLLHLATGPGPSPLSH
ncbi:MAG: phosphoribosyltransferase [Deltaproteobacteria bacterium]|nr:phosphoribosyltransferase [Deltaproteobacteria bacterium]